MHQGKGLTHPYACSELVVIACTGRCADDEKTKQKKKKLQKSYKSKLRFHRMDQATKGKAEAWRNFVSGKGGLVRSRCSDIKNGGEPW